MPEGDTVYKLAQRLRSALDGNVLRAGRLNVPAHATENLAGLTVTGHRTHGKHLLTDFDDGSTLHTHLKMSGSWTVTKRRLPPHVTPDIRVALTTVDGTSAFGLTLPVVQYAHTAECARTFVDHLGPDVLHEKFDHTLAVHNITAQGNRAIVESLLDQRVVAGPGNLWANEICFLRGLYPWTPSKGVDAERLVALLRRAMLHSATVPKAMQVTTGDTRRGKQHWVAGRAGKPCMRCGTNIEVVAEVPNEPYRRRTWWCPRCQPE